MSVAYRLLLDGLQEPPTPPGIVTPASGRGYAIFDSDTSSLFYSVHVSGLDFGPYAGEAQQTPGTTMDNVTDAHFHAAVRGVSGGVILGLKADVDDFSISAAAPDGSRVISGRWETTDTPSITPFLGTFGAAGPLGSDISVYLNFHTVAHVAGEIRGQLVRIATDASETVTGTSGIDVLPGLGGDDVLIGGAGADVIDGGAGIDTASYDPSGAVNVSLATGTGTGGDAEGDTLTNIENLIGSQFNDTLTGDADDNVLDGGAGGDLLTGGGGDDTYIVDSGFDVLVEAPNEGTDTVIASLRWTLATNFENLTLVGSGNFFGTGNNVANVITGNSGANVLDGKGGNDTLSGGDGFDTLIGGAGNDVMMGGTGNDKYIVDSVNDSVSEEVGEGTDTVRSSVTFTLGANVENLSLLGAAAIDGTGNSLVNIMVGNSAANTLLGLDGNDNLAGLGGNDVLAGGAGRDRLNGGAGADAFVFDTTPVNVTNTDVIADFTPGEDQIWLDSAVYTALGGPGALAAGALHIVTSGFAAADAADRIIYNSSNGALWYDADGNGAGAAVFFAQLSAGLALTEADFLVI